MPPASLPAMAVMMPGPMAARMSSRRLGARLGPTPGCSLAGMPVSASSEAARAISRSLPVRDGAAAALVISRFFAFTDIASLA